MKLSVIIPTCNRNHHLGLCLERLLPGRQIFGAGDYEIIVTDDGSEFSAEAFCKEQFPSVKYTRGPQRGPAANRNYGAAIAQYDWLVFLDDDCLPDAQLLESYAIAIAANPTAHVLEGVILPEGPKPNALAFAPIKEVPGFLWSCNFCISKKAFQSVGGFDEHFKYAHMEDKDFQVRVEAAGYPLLFVPAASVVHPWRVMNDGKTLAFREESFVYYCAKHQKTFKPPVYVKKLFFFYFSRVREKWSVRDAWYLAKQYFTHLFFFFRLYPGWKKKYGLG